MRYRQLDSRLHTSVGDVRLPREIQGFVPGKSFIDSLLSKCLFVSTTPGQEAGFCFDTPDGSTPEPSDTQLVQISPAHQRSFEITNVQLPLEWEDEYGNTYSSLTLKGINLSNPGIMETATAPDGLILYGLQESSVTERILKASQLLRENNVSTEYILGVSEPKELTIPLYEGGVDATINISIQEYKQQQIEAHWRQLPESQQTLEELARITDIITRMSFLVTARAMDTKYRFSDILNYDKCRDGFFAYLHEQGITDQRLSSTDKNDGSRYIIDVLAPRLGVNVAKLHRLGLTHGFLHAGNVTALGGIVDLDSVTGLTLYPDDTPQTSEKELSDLVLCLDSLTTSARAYLSLFTPNSSGMTHARTFLVSYIQERIKGLTDKETLSVLGDLHMTLTANANRTLISDTDSTAYAVIGDVVSEYAVQRFMPHGYTAFHENIIELINNGEYITDVLKQNYETLQCTISDLFFEHIIGQTPATALKILGKLKDKDNDTTLTIAEFTGYEIAPLIINACMVQALNEEQNEEQKNIKILALNRIFSRDTEKWHDLIATKVRMTVNSLLSDAIKTLSHDISTTDDLPLINISPDKCIMSSINSGRLPLESCYVDIKSLAEIIEKKGLDVSLEARQFSKIRNGNLELESSDDESVVQVISNYYIDGYTVTTNRESPTIRLETSNLDYVLVVYTTNRGHCYKLFINDGITLSVNNNTERNSLSLDMLQSICQSNRTPNQLTLDDYQETLFTVPD